MGTLPHYLYSNKISEVIESTVSYDLSISSQSESNIRHKEAVSPIDQPREDSNDEQPDLSISRQLESSLPHKEGVSPIDQPREDSNDEQPDQFDDSGDDDDSADYEEPPKESDLGNALDDGSVFLVGRSSRFGRSIKINSKLFL